MGGIKDHYLEQEISKVTIYIVIGIFWGVSLFGIIYGFGIIIPTNVSWLWQGEDGDRVLLQEGWEYFRRAEWLWPVGRYKAYPYPFLNSIIFTDTLPLVSVPLKCIRNILPEMFQFWGMWLFVCFILQGVIASLILKCEKMDVHKTICAVPFFFLNVCFLNQSYNHFTNMGQWTILLGLYLYLNPVIRNAKPVNKLIDWGGYWPYR